MLALPIFVPNKSRAAKVVWLFGAMSFPAAERSLKAVDCERVKSSQYLRAGQRITLAFPLPSTAFEIISDPFVLVMA